jgi:chorismate dehydratase
VPLRISIVQYLNTAPLVRGFTNGPLRGKYQLSFTVPSQCAEALRTGAADVAIIPAIEYQRIADLVVLPNLSIASKKSVRSLLLVSKKPIAEVTRVALDRSSRSTQVLVCILCAKRWGIAPECFEADPDLPAMLEAADAALLIGDPALRLALDAESHGTRDAAERMRCPGTLAGQPEGTDLFVYDVVEQWHALTRLPAVLAVWAARRDVATPEVVRDFQQSLAFGLEHLDEVSVEAARGLGLPVGKLRRYLEENIDYTLDSENLRGLARYFSYAAELGIIPGVKGIVRAAEAGAAGLHSDFFAARRH